MQNPQAHQRKEQLTGELELIILQVKWFSVTVTLHM